MNRPSTGGSQRIRTSAPRRKKTSNAANRITIAVWYSPI